MSNFVRYLISYFILGAAFIFAPISSEKDAMTLELEDIDNNTRACYEFSWSSQEPQASENGSKVFCEDPETIPCFENNYVVTKEPMTPEQIKEYANRTGSYCDKAGLSCVKYSYFTTGKDPVMYYSTRFCGKGVDTGKGTPIRKGCHDIDYKEKGRTLEVCFCDGPLCNRSPQQSQISLAALAASTLVPLMYSWLK